MYKDDFEACLGIENFTRSLEIGDVLNIHAYMMEWADAIHRGDKMESEFYRGRLYGIVEGLAMAHQLKDGYTHKRVFGHFEKFATDWGHDEAYWLRETYEELQRTYEYFVESVMDSDDEGDIRHANAMKNALDYIKSKSDEYENKKEN